MIKTITIECPLTDLMDVLNATGNAKAAAEILNGTYTEPWFPQEIIAEFRTERVVHIVNGIEEEIETKEPVIYKALDYNPFTDVIRYTFENSHGITREDYMEFRFWMHRYQRNGSPYAVEACDDYV